METTFIYGLFDPRNGELRYIGKSDNPKKRLCQHIKEAKRERRNSYLYNWLRILLKQNFRPILEILEECNFDNWQQAERFWIILSREIGLRLTNWTDGGDGVSSFTNKGRIFSEEHKHNLSIAGRDRVFSEEHKRNLSTSSIGKNIGNKNALGYKHTKETKQRISITLKGNPPRAWLGKHLSNVHKQKLSEAQKRYWEKKKNNE